jgi:ferredoxin
MLRKIIKINEDKCDGCGECIPSCHEGALQIIDGKCRLISDLFCDGLGACVGECSKGALEIVEAEAKEYSEISVINELLNKPPSVMQAHLSHLHEHGANEFLAQAIEYLNSLGIDVKLNEKVVPAKIENEKSTGCPGSQMLELKQIKPKTVKQTNNQSMLEQWPVQLHLVNPNSPFLIDKELIILATCVPLAYANTHEEYLRDKAVVIACPKLDYTDPYTKKIEDIIKTAKVSKATVVRMEVPCCSGLCIMSLKGASQANISGFKLSEHIISTTGDKVSQKIIFEN